jgi:geranylgeranyl reductase family protein
MIMPNEVIGRAEVAVIGAGPGGSVAAWALARLGRETILLDRAHFPRPKPCGDYVNPAGMRLLADIGVGDEIGLKARPLRGMLIVSPNGREVLARFPEGPGVSIPRDILDHIVLRAAERAGADVRTGTAMRGIARKRNLWHVRTTEGIVEARVLIGADGLRSLVARSTGLRRAPSEGSRSRRDVNHTRDRYAIGMYVDGLPIHDGYAEMHLGRGVYCGVSAFRNAPANVTAVAPKSRFSRGTTVSARLSSILREFPRLWPRLEPRLHGGAETGAPRAVGPLVPHRGRVTADGLLLVGDAAAFVDPLTGQGVALALRSGLEAAETIDRALRNGDVHDRGLAPYARWHQRTYGRFRALLRLVDYVALHSPLIEPLSRAWGHAPNLAAAFMNVIADGAHPRLLLRPSYLAGTMLACIQRA